MSADILWPAGMLFVPLAASLVDLCFLFVSQEGDKWSSKSRCISGLDVTQPRGWCSLSRGLNFRAKDLHFVFQFIMIFTWVDYVPSHYGDYHYPAWADAMGWMMSMTSVSAIPIVMIYQICKHRSQYSSLWEVSYLFLSLPLSSLLTFLSHITLIIIFLPDN